MLGNVPGLVTAVKQPLESGAGLWLGREMSGGICSRYAFHQKHMQEKTDVYSLAAWQGFTSPCWIFFAMGRRWGENASSPRAAIRIPGPCA